MGNRKSRQSQTVTDDECFIATKKTKVQINGRNGFGTCNIRIVQTEYGANNCKKSEEICEIENVYGDHNSVVDLTCLNQYKNNHKSFSSNKDIFESKAKQSEKEEDCLQKYPCFHVEDNTIAKEYSYTRDGFQGIHHAKVLPTKGCLSVLDNSDMISSVGIAEQRDELSRYEAEHQLNRKKEMFDAFVKDAFRKIKHGYNDKQNIFDIDKSKSSSFEVVSIRNNQENDTYGNNSIEETSRHMRDDSYCSDLPVHATSKEVNPNHEVHCLGSPSKLNTNQTCPIETNTDIINKEKENDGNKQIKELSYVCPSEDVGDISLISNERDRSLLSGSTENTWHFTKHEGTRDQTKKNETCHTKPISGLAGKKQAKNTLPNAYISAHDSIGSRNSEKSTTEFVETDIKDKMWIFSRVYVQPMNDESLARQTIFYPLQCKDSDRSKVSFCDDSGYVSLCSMRSTLISKQANELDNGTARMGKELEYNLKRALSALEFNLESFVVNNDRVIVFPALQTYFESLRNDTSLNVRAQMSYEWLRLKTFSNYNGGGRPVFLARGGFFHEQQNQTRCYSCDVAYSDWSDTDDVRAVHMRISPNCPFLNGGITSSGNIPVENSVQESQPSQQHFARGTSDLPVSSHIFVRAERQPPTDILAEGNRFSSMSNAELNQEDQSCGANVVAGTEVNADCTGNRVPGFEFRPNGHHSNHNSDAPPQPPGAIEQISDDVRSEEGRLPRICMTATSQRQHQHQQIHSQSGDLSSGCCYPVSAGRNTNRADQLGYIAHSQYSAVPERQASFATWPSYLKQSPRDMAIAGFLYSGYSDFACCFCCGGRVGKWDEDHDPYREHARWFPECEYINQLKGTRFVQDVSRIHAEQMAQWNRQQAHPNDGSRVRPEQRCMTARIPENYREREINVTESKENIVAVSRFGGKCKSVIYSIKHPLLT